jgi:PhnB protein
MKPEMTRQNDEQAIREVIESQLAALSAKDVKGSISVYTPKDNVMYTLAPPLRSQNSDEATAGASVQEWFDTWDGPIKYETRDLQIIVSGDLALSTSLRHMIGDQNGQQVDMWFRKTLGLRRIDGQWKIFHDHESVPMRMDGSMKAAVDLKPEG